ncbi:hypothetical protein Tco_1132017 [Tanacetum coccineum]|uniref:Uncharacterized protein n=1 Tax=Tanacetum coccineum TaxID=301880 RepID=A0ABQ5JBU1_9ASTR
MCLDRTVGSPVCDIFSVNCEDIQNCQYEADIESHSACQSIQDSSCSRGMNDESGVDFSRVETHTYTKPYVRFQYSDLAMMDDDDSRRVLFLSELIPRVMSVLCGDTRERRCMREKVFDPCGGCVGAEIISSTYVSRASQPSEDTIFDPGISVFSFYSLEPVVSHQSGTFMCFNVFAMRPQDYEGTLVLVVLVYQIDDGELLSLHA